MRLVDPRVVVPSLKVTVPLGAPAPGATTLTDAVNVTVWPNTDGFGEELSEVTVLSLLTTWLTTVEVLAVKLPSPLYTAVIEREPTNRLLDVSVA